MNTLADELPKEQERVRDLIELYSTIGPHGAFAVACMKLSLSNAEKAASSGDIVEMVRALKDLRSYKE